MTVASGGARVQSGATSPSSQSSGTALNPTQKVTTLQRRVATASDRALLHRVASFAREQRRLKVYLVTALAEVETRGLHLGAGFPGLWEYCRSLGLSEGEAWRRIQAARLVRKFPEVLESLAVGRLHLSGVSCLVLTSRPRHGL